jgi:hypothetical protein
LIAKARMLLLKNAYSETVLADVQYEFNAELVAELEIRIFRISFCGNGLMPF